MRDGSPYQMLTLPEIVGRLGLLTDGDWVESKDQDPGGTVRLTQLADVGDGEFRDRSDRWMNDEQATRLSVTFLKPGDVLIARMPDPLGRACVVPALSTRAVTVVDVCVVRAPEHNPKWLMHALNSPQIRAEIATFQAGSTRKRISKGNLATIPLPVPSRSVQDALVGAIETHFSRLDAAATSLTRAKANLKRARASVLKAAVEGRLVATEAALARAEGRDYEPASALLARILAERKASWAKSGARGKYAEPTAPETAGLPELPEGWAWVTLDTVAARVDGGNAATAMSVSAPRRVLRSSALRQGSIDWNDHRFLPPDAPKGNDPYLAPGQLLFTRLSGSLAYVGNCAFVRTAPAEMEFPDRIFRALPVESTDGRFIQHCFAVPHLRRGLESRAKSTAGHQRISLSDLRCFTIPLPPLPEQLRITAEVDRRLSVLDTLEATVDANLARCARLRQAILKQAFEGRLVPPADDASPWLATAPPPPGGPRPTPETTPPTRTHP